jgi:class 3 adenylate cyclase
MATERPRLLTTHDLLVVVFDMCSSSDIIEGLTLRGELHRLETFLTAVKRYLRGKVKDNLFDVYKFLGDGWILLFPPDVDGAVLLSFLKGLCEFFQRELKRKVLRHLDAVPQVTGVTLGLERGPLLKTVMFGQREYIGRPLNIACRLQTAIKDKDKSPAYKALVSNAVYNDYFRELRGVKSIPVSRTLRNIRGGTVFKCRKLTLASKGGRDLTARSRRARGKAARAA